MNTKANIKFADGTPVAAVTEAEYLGGVVSQKNLTRKELENRLGKAIATANKLKVFFKKASQAGHGKSGFTMLL